MKSNAGFLAFFGDHFGNNTIQRTNPKPKPGRRGQDPALRWLGNDCTAQKRYRAVPRSPGLCSSPVRHWGEAPCASNYNLPGKADMYIEICHIGWYSKTEMKDVLYRILEERL